jgi:DNA-binding MarR family transcriptional regulator
LLVLSRLMAEGRPIPFTELRDRLALTDGSLSVHLQRLAAGGIIDLEKRFVDKRPQTLVHITDAGRAAFVAYVSELAEIVPGLESRRS